MTDTAKPDLPAPEPGRPAAQAATSRRAASIGGMDTPDPRFWQAVLVGLGIAAPVGPIGLLTIRRTLEGGVAAGLATGLGAACADALYGALGAWGVQAAVAWLVGLRGPLALGGGALLLWMA